MKINSFEHDLIYVSSFDLSVFVTHVASNIEFFSNALQAFQFGSIFSL